MTKIYKTAWFLLTILFLATVLTGNFSPVSLFVFSLIALGLVHALALWTVVINTKQFTHQRGIKQSIFKMEEKL